MSARRQPRVAFDTALVLQALLFNDRKAQLLRWSWQTGQCQALIATGSAQALMKALAFPAFKLDEVQQQELLADFLPYAEVVDEGSAGAESRAKAAPLHVLARSAASSLDHIVSDCQQLRAELGVYAQSLPQGGFSCVGAEEFLAIL
jgi:hypothetical protein